MCEEYLLTQHKNTIIKILEDTENIRHHSININFLELFENNPNLGNSVLKEPEKALEDWNKAVISVQNDLLEPDTKFVVKNNVHCRIYGLPICPELHKSRFPQNEDANKFLQVAGTVIRMTSPKMLEYQRQYICTKCKYVMAVQAEYDKKNIIVCPKKCSSPEGCKSTNIITCGELESDFCKDYQEIKIQENVSKLGVGSIPTSMWVTLEDDLVDSSKPGDNITICGVVKRRWGLFSPGKKMDVELVLKANHIQVNNSNGSAMLITPEVKNMFEQFWETHANSPLVARDTILKSFCPQIFGLHIVKLAMAVVLAGGSHVPNDTSTGVSVRSEPHLLLVGDPGTGKSQLLRFASKIIPRSVLTTGVGSTAAGLTVTAVMEDGEWQLEGGALVLSDGGICCIDEFNSMREHDRTSIHEAMEQQTISVAKASIVCKLSTKCSILAATNPKGNLDSTQPLSMNIALPSPLLSRFDLILLLRDVVHEEWDTSVADYILNGRNNFSKLTDNVIWGVDILQAYFAVIKKNHPTLTEDSKQILSSYYQIQRRANCRNKARTTVRLLDSLVRLSQGHARLMFHKEVEIIDAVIAVVLVEIAMEVESSVLNIQFDVHSSFPENPLQTYKELVEIVLSKLQLNDLLEKEIENINEKLSFKTNHCDRNHSDNEIIKYKMESKYFHLQSHLNNKIDENVSTKIISTKKHELEEENRNANNENRFRNVKNKRNSGNGGDKPNKKFKLNHENAVNDLETLEVITGIPKDFPLSDLLNDNDVEISLEKEQLNTDFIKEKSLKTNQINETLINNASNSSEDENTINVSRKMNKKSDKENKFVKEIQIKSSKNRKHNNSNGNRSNKIIKTNEENVLNDLQTLKLIPSVNDDFPFADLLNDNINEDTECMNLRNEEENLNVTETEKSNKSTISASPDVDSGTDHKNGTLSDVSHEPTGKPKVMSFLNKFRFKKPTADATPDIQTADSGFSDDGLKCSVTSRTTIFENEDEGIDSLDLDL